MFTTNHRRIFGLGVAVATVLTSVGVTNAAGPDVSGVVTREPTHDTSWYPDVDDGLVLLYGPALGDGGCVDENFPETTLSTIEKPNGSTKLQKVFHDGPIQVYRSDDPFNFFEQCERLFDGDPATVVDEPIATGSGELVMHWWVHPDGSVDIRNQVVGSVQWADGTASPIRARAAYTVSSTGEADFKVLDIDS